MILKNETIPSVLSLQLAYTNFFSSLFLSLFDFISCYVYFFLFFIFNVPQNLCLTVLCHFNVCMLLRLLLLKLEKGSPVEHTDTQQAPICQGELIYDS